MKITISNIIEIEEPDDLIKKYCSDILTFKNPDYIKKAKMGFWCGKTPKTIKLYSNDTNKVYLPIGCLNDLQSVYTIDADYRYFKPFENDYIKSSIIPRKYQELVLDAIKTNDNGIIIAPTGLGKTQMALMIIQKLNTKTLFVTHTSDLLNQAKLRCENNLDCKVSVITEGKVDLSGDVVFATVQTLSNHLDDIPQDTFGCYIQDELHHLCQSGETISMFKECLDYFAAKYKYGLTATLHRADGLHNTIPKLIGNIIYNIDDDAKNNEYVCILNGEEVLRFNKDEYQTPAKVHYIETNYKVSHKEGDEVIYDEDVFDKDGATIVFSKLITSIANNVKRNEIIKKLVTNLNGSTIILSDRVEQLEYLHKQLPNSVVVTGKTKKKDRELYLDQVRNGKVKILLSSYQLAKEGLDLPILANLVLATPVKDEAVIIQAIGRIQRKYDGKEIANVYDLVDNVSMLFRFKELRNRIYRKKRWL